MTILNVMSKLIEITDLDEARINLIISVIKQNKNADFISELTKLQCKIVIGAKLTKTDLELFQKYCGKI